MKTEEGRRKHQDQKIGNIIDLFLLLRLGFCVLNFHSKSSSSKLRSKTQCFSVEKWICQFAGVLMVYIITVFILSEITSAFSGSLDALSHWITMIQSQHRFTGFRSQVTRRSHCAGHKMPWCPRRTLGSRPPRPGCWPAAAVSWPACKSEARYRHRPIWGRYYLASLFHVTLLIH